MLDFFTFYASGIPNNAMIPYKKNQLVSSDSGIEHTFSSEKKWAAWSGLE